MAATHTGWSRCRPRPRRLEAFTWTRVLGALGAGGRLALLGTAIIAAG